MKYLLKNERVCRRVLIIICFFILMIFVNMRAADKVFALDLKSQAEDFIKQERFVDLLDFLDILKQEKRQDIGDLQIEYYTVLAKSKYLDYLEQKEDWENYYTYVDIFNAEIIKSAKDIVGNYFASLETIDMQYLAWKAYVRDEETESAEAAFDKLIETVIAYTEKSNDTDSFQEIAQRISDQGRGRQLNKLFNSYKEFLSKNAQSDSIERLGAIAQGYMEKKNIETSIVIYEHFIDLVLKQYSQERALFVLGELCDKFRHHGFIRAKDAEFAEKIYGLITRKFGEDALSEEDLFARGYNLEALNLYSRAQEEYKYFAKKFTKSVYLPEVYTRLGIINLYSVGQTGMSLQFFQKVSDEFQDSFYAPFCAYNAAMILQWNSENIQASGLYSRIVSLPGPYSEAAKERLNEIKNELKLNDDLRYVLESISGTEESSAIVLTLQSRPQRAFTGNKVVWSATAQDFSSGTVQPSFTYEWFGDTGSNKDPGNVLKFSATYNEVMPHVACFSARAAQTKGVICKALWVHELRVKVPDDSLNFKAGEQFELTAEVFPSSIEDKGILWQWKIGSEVIDGKGNKLLYSFDEPGRYEIELVANILGSQVFKKFNVNISEYATAGI